LSGEPGQLTLARVPEHGIGACSVVPTLVDSVFAG
jgi:hypothetical protein